MIASFGWYQLRYTVSLTLIMTGSYDSHGGIIANKQSFLLRTSNKEHSF